MKPERGTHIREFFISNAAFGRFARGFEIYQHIINDQSLNQKDREVIRSRMHEAYGADESKFKDYKTLVGGKLSKENDKESSKSHMTSKHEADSFVAVALELCESGVFTKEKLADLFASGSARLMDIFVEEWNPKPGRDAKTGRELVNEIVAFRYLDQHTIAIDIVPTSIKDNMLEKIYEGFKIIARKMKNGLPGIDRVSFKSWLLGPSFEDKIKILMGNEIKFFDVDSTDPMTNRAQHQALFYNGRSLEQYLITGEKPVIRAVEMTRQEFLGRFLGESNKPDPAPIARSITGTNKA